MEEARWAARVLSEIGSARAAIAASYLSLWRTGTGLPDLQRDEPEAVPGEQQEETSPPPPTRTEGAEQA
jgi:hypothetical protein